MALVASFQDFIQVVIHISWKCVDLGLGWQGLVNITANVWCDDTVLTCTRKLAVKPASTARPKINRKKN